MPEADLGIDLHLKKEKNPPREKSRLVLTQREEKSHFKKRAWWAPLLSSEDSEDSSEDF